MIQLQNVSKIYKGSDYKTLALNDINLLIEEGEFLAIMGSSGSGKTTLLNIIGCMDSPTEGKYFLSGKDVAGCKECELTEIRKEHISFVFQNFALMPDYTVYENVEIPLLAKNIKRKERKKVVVEKLKMMGVGDLVNKLPSQISGGQQQRVAIARALVADNSVILADEPTGALDQKNSMELMDILEKINQSGKTIILITHDQKVADRAHRVIHIVDGCLSDEDK